MAVDFRATKVFLLFLVFVLFAAASLLCVCAESDESRNGDFFPRGRRILESPEDDQPKKKKTLPLTLPIPTKSDSSKLIKSPNQSSKNQTKQLTKNKFSTNSTKLTSAAVVLKLNSTAKLPKLNSTKLTSTAKLPKLNSTSKSTSLSAKKSPDLLKLTTPKNKTTTPSSSKQSETHLEKQNKEQKPEKKPKKQAQAKPSWVDDDDEDDKDLVWEFRDLPTKFQKTLIPDLERISTTSKAYITKANKQMTMGFKPIVGNKYASSIASLISFAFILIPLILVSLIFNRIKAYFSLQKLLIFIQIYLSIYFGILCFSSLATGLEPLKFFYSTSQPTYICLQVMQTLGYILYLLLLVMYLVLVFSTDCGLGSRLLGLAQTFVGYAVGLHYYVAVFHRMVLHQPPRTNWKIHGIYATCFLVICVLAGAERRKKAYLEEGGAEGKKS